MNLDHIKSLDDLERAWKASEKPKKKAPESAAATLERLEALLEEGDQEAYNRACGVAVSSRMDEYKQVLKGMMDRGVPDPSEEAQSRMNDLLMRTFMAVASRDIRSALEALGALLSFARDLDSGKVS